MNAPHPIPAGYLQDPQGRLIPDSMVSELDKLRDQTARDIAAEATALRAQLVAFKRRSTTSLGAATRAM